jgi:hypothetical protein
MSLLAIKYSKFNLIAFLIMSFKFTVLYRLLFQISPIKIVLNEIYNGIIQKQAD